MICRRLNDRGQGVLARINQHAVAISKKPGWSDFGPRPGLAELTPGPPLIECESAGIAFVPLPRIDLPA